MFPLFWEVLPIFHQVFSLLFSNSSHFSNRTIILWVGIPITHVGIPIIFASYIQYFTRYSHYYCSVPIISVPNDSSSYFHYFVGCSQYSTYYFVKCSHFKQLFPLLCKVFPLLLPGIPSILSSVPTYLKCSHFLADNPYKLCTAKRLKSTHALSKFHLLTDSVPHPLPPPLDGPNLNPESNHKPLLLLLQDMCV